MPNNTTFKEYPCIGTGIIIKPEELELQNCIKIEVCLNTSEVMPTNFINVYVFLYIFVYIHI